VAVLGFNDGVDVKASEVHRVVARTAITANDAAFGILAIGDIPLFMMNLLVYLFCCNGCRRLP